MPIVRVAIHLPVPPEIAFDLARDIGLHQHLAQASRERAVAGVTNGLIGLDESVTFEARHLGLRHRLTSKVVEFDPPHQFVDEMTEGPFRRMRHEHRFEPDGTGTLMTDVLDFESPFGAPIDRFLLAPYMRRFLLQRGQALARWAELDRT